MAGSNALSRSRTAGISLDFPRGDLAGDRAYAVRQRRDQVRAFRPCPLRRAQYGQHLRAGISGPCSIAASDRDPAITVPVPTASRPASTRRCPRFFRGSGT
jgi:hypothetical protein